MNLALKFQHIFLEKPVEFFGKFGHNQNSEKESDLLSLHV